MEEKNQNNLMNSELLIEHMLELQSLIKLLVEKGVITREEMVNQKTQLREVLKQRLDEYFKEKNEGDGENEAE